MSGAWTLASGGAAGDGGTCPPLPGTTLTVEQSTSALRAEYADQELNGTLYDTFDFTLRSGAGAMPRLTLRGRYVPGIADGGATLQGTLQRDDGADGGTGCIGGAPFTATR